MMRRLLLAVLLFPLQFIAQPLIGDDYADSVLLRIENRKNEQGINWIVENVTNDNRASDSLLLQLHTMLYEFNLTSDANGSRWRTVKALTNQGIVLEHMNADSSQVLSKFRKADSLAILHDNKSNMLWTSIRIAKYYLNLGYLNNEEEIRHYTRVQELSKDTSLHAETRYLGYRYLGNRHTRYNDFNTAFEYYYQAYEMARIQDDVELIVKLCNNLLLITERTNDTTGNANLISKTRSLIPENDYYYQALYYSNLAGYNYLDDSTKEKEYLDKALLNFNRSKNKEHIITLYMSYCDYYYDRNNRDSTLYFKNKIKSTLQSLPSTQIFYNDIFFLIYEAKYLNLINAHPEAMNTLDTAYNLAINKNALFVIPGILENKYLFSQKHGDYETAFNHLINYKTLNDSLNSVERQTQYQNLFVKFETEEKQKKINTLQNEKALNKQVLEAQRSENFALNIILILVFLFLVGLAYMLFLNRKKSKSLQVLNNVKDKIFTVLSHDLRSPLYTFNSLLEIGKMKSISPDEYSKYLSMIQSEVGNTTLLLESLLKWSQNNLNMLYVQEETVAITPLLESIQSRASLYNRRENVDVQLNIESDISISTDEDMLRFIIRNLTNNALKFSSDNDNVVINAKKELKSIIISIKDSGKGMTPEQIDAFYSGNMEASIDAVGDKSTGLGLLLCKEFADKLGLEIELISSLGKGTEFKIVLKK
jgi:signal transduction histidine kinase